MKVWMVERVDYDLQETIGVFLTARKAKRVAAALEAAGGWGYVHVTGLVLGRWNA